MPNELNANAQKWVKALRSGDYKRGRRALHMVTGNASQFCCLGVACELYRQEVGGEWVPDDPHRQVFKVGLFDADTQLLPPPVRDWLGIKTTDGDFSPTGGGASRSLTQLNDSYDFDFCKIADVIESRPKGLFNAKR